MELEKPSAAASEPSTATPTKEELLEKLLCAHEVYYDVQRDLSFGGKVFPGYAEFHTHGEKFVLVKKAKLWEVNAHEYLFFMITDELDAPFLEDAITFMTTAALQKIEPEPDHMTSYISLVIIADSVTPDAAKKLRRSRFRKNLALGFKGWIDLRLAAIDLGARRVITNGQGKELLPALEGNLQRAFGS